MSILEIIFIGVALAMDAFALTVANCTTYKKTLSKQQEWSMPTAFALFQFLMPVIGYYIGSVFAEYISSVSGFVTAGIFFVLSAKIVVDNIKEMKSEAQTVERESGNFNLKILTIQAIATSIDALMIGVTFAVELPFNIFIAGLIIGAVTFIIVAIALFIGKSLGKLLGKYATWAGAVILFTLSVKNLITAIL